MPDKLRLSLDFFFDKVPLFDNRLALVVFDKVPI
jgi:hypothetical protein